jgi:hypothetical protein
MLPHYFHNIRHYGLCSSHHVAINTIGKACEMLKPAEQRVEPKPCAPAIDSVEERTPVETWAECLLALTGVNVKRCLRCKHGRMLPAPFTVVNGHAHEDSS